MNADTKALNPKPLPWPQVAKDGSVEEVEDWATRLAKSLKEDSIVILLDACALNPRPRTLKLWCSPGGVVTARQGRRLARAPGAAALRVYGCLGPEAWIHHQTLAQHGRCHHSVFFAVVLKP